MRLIRLEFRAAHSWEPWIPVYGSQFRTLEEARWQARRWTAAGCLEYRLVHSPMAARLDLSAYQTPTP